MQKKSVALLAGLLVVTLGASTGCVSKKVFRKNVEETDTPCRPSRWLGWRQSSPR